MKKVLVITFLGLIIFLSCSKDNGGSGGGGGGGTTVDCSSVLNKAFAADVAPIIASTCATSASCHATGSSNGPGALTNYTQVFNARSTIKTSVQSGRMPQGSTLATSQKNSIICWIDSGAPNN